MEVFLIWLLFGIISGIVASNKGRSGCGWFLLGVLLGPFGLILALVVSKNLATVEKKAVQVGEMKKCPFCAELIKAEAIKCRFCGEVFCPNSVVGIDALSPDERSICDIYSRIKMESGDTLTHEEILLKMEGEYRFSESSINDAVTKGKIEQARRFTWGL